MQATIALALSRLAAFTDDATTADLAALAPASTANIKEDTVGPITTVYFAPGEADTALGTFPPRVQRLLLASMEGARGAQQVDAPLVRSVLSMLVELGINSTAVY